MTAAAHSHVPDGLLARQGELGVLSALLVEESGVWSVTSGSLLALDPGWARTSWKRWGELQPSTRGLRYDSGGFDLGPVFAVEPFPGLRAMRQMVEPKDMTDLVSEIEAGHLATPWGSAQLNLTGWSSTVFLSRNSSVSAAAVVLGARRPVTAVVADLTAPKPKESDATWEWPLPPGMKPGPDLGRIAPHRRLLHWPDALLGMRWLGDPKFDPTSNFVVGRPHTDVWIADVVPDYDEGDLIICICWNAVVADRCHARCRRGCEVTFWRINVTL